MVDISGLNIFILWHRIKYGNTLEDLKSATFFFCRITLKLLMQISIFTRKLILKYSENNFVFLVVVKKNEHFLMFQLRIKLPCFFYIVLTKLRNNVFPLCFFLYVFFLMFFLLVYFEYNNSI